MTLLGGMLVCEVAYVPIPYNYIPPLKIYFIPIKGDHGPLCILAIPVTVVQPGRSTGGQNEGAKRPSGGGCAWEGVSPSNGREIFQNLCLKTAFSCTLDTFIRGSLCSGIDQSLLSVLS